LILLRFLSSFWKIFRMIPFASIVAEWMPMKPPLTEYLAMTIDTASFVALRVLHPTDQDAQSKYPPSF
jgi:hypothetical protein